MKLRILHVNLSSGGLGRYGALFANALSARDDIKVLNIINAGLINSKPLQRILDGVEIIEYPTHNLMQKTELPFVIKKIIRSWKPNIIHDTAGSGYAIGIIALSLAKGSTPLVVTEHDPEPHLGMGTSFHCRLARRLIRRYADHIFVHGPLGKDVLIKKGVEAGRITVIPHGRLDSLFECSHVEVQREPYTILFFGALRPNKGVQFLIPIADSLYAKYPNVKFIVAGSPEVARELRKTGWLQELKKILAEIRKRPYFEVHDRFIPDEEVAFFFRRASITLLPYLDATQSGVAMIAMPFGSVVVATRVGDLPFAINDGVTGYLAEPTIESICDRLDYVLSHPNEVEEVRRKAQNFVATNCSWDKIMKQVVKIYREIIMRREWTTD